MSKAQKVDILPAGLDNFMIGTDPACCVLQGLGSNHNFIEGTRLISNALLQCAERALSTMVGEHSLVIVQKLPRHPKCGCTIP
eukprot:6492652-Amphidinium_carterae.5